MWYKKVPETIRGLMAVARVDDDPFLTGVAFGTRGAFIGGSGRNLVNAIVS